MIDNAGGHGTQGGKGEYKQILKDEFNIIIIWQVPNSPEMNMLDLGVWVSVQSMVENIHRQLVMKNDVLMDSVDRALGRVGLESEALNNIYNRWVKVLQLIIQGKGDNSFVESCRQKYEKVTDVVYVVPKKRVMTAQQL